MTTIKQKYGRKSASTGYGDETVRVSITDNKADGATLNIRVASPLVERCALNGKGTYDLEFVDEDSGRVRLTQFEGGNKMRKGDSDKFFIMQMRMAGAKAFKAKPATDVKPGKDKLEFTLPEGLLEALGGE